MDYDQDKVDGMVLASLTMFNDGAAYRVWKGHDGDALERLYQKGSIWEGEVCSDNRTGRAVRIGGHPAP